MRLLIHVEGQTEETFVDEVLAPHLLPFGYYLVAPRILGNGRFRGGVRPWPEVRKDLVNHLNEDKQCIATTMVDYYALPQKVGREWPGRVDSTQRKLSERAEFLEQAMFEDVQAKVFRPERFIPFVLMHEFEALLFSNCAALSRGLGDDNLRPRFQTVRDQFTHPEEINDSPDTAPSKRILKIFPPYQKPLHGNLAILEIGLPAIRRECPHFDAWLRKLEDLPGIAPAPALR